MFQRILTSMGCFSSVELCVFFQLATIYDSLNFNDLILVFELCEFI